MKREIRFRAKAYNGEWVFGYYFATGKSHFIRNDEGDIWAINPDTLGQFTGLTDKNGKEIYERDAGNEDTEREQMTSPNANRQTLNIRQESHKDYLYYSQIRLLLQRMREEFLEFGREYDFWSGGKPYRLRVAQADKLRVAVIDFLVSDWHNIQRYAEGEELEWRAVWNDKGKIEKFEIGFEK